MAQKKTKAAEKQPEQKSEWLSAKEARAYLRKELGKDFLTKELAGFGTRQPNAEEDLLESSTMNQLQLLNPPYNPSKLQSIVESGGKLGTCIRTYKDNIHGYGYEFRYEGDKKNEKSDEVITEKNMLVGFFNKVNENQSFTTLAKELREDYESTGNAYIEINRYNDGDIATLYRADPKYMRLQVKQDDRIPITVELIRNGKVRPTKILKRFRKFAMIINATQQKVRYFKEWGDPRTLDAISGEYDKIYDLDSEVWKPNPKYEKKEDATEIIHLKIGNGTYGVPRWSGMSSVVLGLSDADYTNYDLFQNASIPALAILVSGGYLTSESVQDIAEVLKGMKGVKNRQRVAILEAQGNDGGTVDDRPTNARVDFKELNRQSDSEFSGYIKSSEKRIQATFRLPPLLTGEAEEYSRSTSDSSKLIAEDQIFVPERNDFDEIINFTLLADMGVKYHRFKTVGPRLMDSDTMVDAYGKLARGGALSINTGVRIANRVLDLDIPRYEGEEWAEIPVAVLLELIKKKQVTKIGNVGMEAVAEGAKNLKEAITDKEFDAISEDLEEIKSQLEELYTLTAQTE